MPTPTQQRLNPRLGACGQFGPVATEDNVIIRGTSAFEWNAARQNLVTRHRVAIHVSFLREQVRLFMHIMVLHCKQYLRCPPEPRPHNPNRAFKICDAASEEMATGRLKARNQVFGRDGMRLDEHVGCLQVAVDDAVLVQRSHPSCNLQHALLRHVIREGRPPPIACVLHAKVNELPKVAPVLPQPKRKPGPDFNVSDLNVFMCTVESR